MQTIKRHRRVKNFVKTPVGLAAVILAVIIAYVTIGSLFGGGGANGTPGEAENNEETEELFLVKAKVLNAQNYIENIQVRGRTEALRTVELKAEEEGRVILTPIEKGERVKKGALICQISANDREANLAQARALAAEKQLQYNANLELAKEGYRSDTQVAAAKAELDSANAQVSRAQVALDNTKIRAPFDGLLNDRAVEIGDFMQVGTTCGILLTEDPYLVVGEVSDRQVDRITPGQPAIVELTNGTTLEGKVRYISSAARVETRTFRVEVEIPNTELKLREGMTATILIPTESAKAHFLTPSLLTLKDDGAVGIRIVKDGTVKFFPITIAGNSPGGLWVKGLPDQIELIITGQNFVIEGQKVRVSLEDGENE